MPYNNTPINPSTEITGSVSLPLARIKRIIAADPDIASCSNNAAFVITVATEMFLQHLVEQSYNIVKSERKPRRNVQYRDVAQAVARVENLEFLGDVVPKTVSFKQYKGKVKEREGAKAGEGEKGQTTLGAGFGAGKKGEVQEMGMGEGQAGDGAVVDAAAGQADEDADVDMERDDEVHESIAVAEGDNRKSGEVTMKESGSEA